MELDKLMVQILIQDQLVRNAKARVARMQIRWEQSGEELRGAKDDLHDEQVTLQNLRDAFAARAA